MIAPSVVKTTVYLRDDTMADLDELRSQLRREGMRGASMNGLVQAALDLAVTAQPALLDLVRRQGGAT